MSTTIKLKGRVDEKRLIGKINLVPSASSGGPLQAKTVYPSHSEQVIAPDEDYYGLAVVTVKPVPRVPACEVRVKEGADATVEIPVNIAVGTKVSGRSIYIEDSWETIAQNCENGKAEGLYVLGDKKIITLTWSDGTTEANELELIGINHDDLADGTGKATLTFFSTYLIEQTKKMNTSNRNDGGWAGNYSLRSWCNGELYNALPSDLRNVIQTVKKLSDGGYNSTSLVETHDKVWFPSMAEAAFEGLQPTVAGQGAKYEYISRFDNDSISWRGKYTGAVSNNTRRYWWSRTSITNTSNQWGMFGMWGGFSLNAANASDMGVGFGLCVGSRT